jgi:hypothetical protein
MMDTCALSFDTMPAPVFADGLTVKSVSDQWRSMMHMLKSCVVGERALD